MSHAAHANLAASRTRLTLPAHDGHALIAYRHAPVQAQAARAHVVIAPGMAIPQSFYAAFAAHLAGQGYCVWTFDYRGMGESRAGGLRACAADLTDWIRQDYDAVLRHAAADVEQAPLFVLGHSLGGQVAPLVPAMQQVSGIINIAVACGTPRYNQPKVRRMAPLLWHVLTPVLCRLFGYFPGRRIGVLGDIPRNVMFQWRRWCMAPDYLLSGEPGAREAYARLRLPVLGLMFNDDELLLESGSKLLHDAYSGAQVDYRVLSPQQFGLPRVGHFGFFRNGQDKLWPLVTDWLQQHVAAIA